MGKLKGAISELQQTLEIDPKFAYGHYNIGLNLRISGRPEEANRAFTQSDCHQSHIRPYAFQSGTCVEGPGATGRFDRPLPSHPQLGSEIRRWLGVFSASLSPRPENTKEAIENFQHALKIDPSDVYSRNDLGRALAETGRLDEAVENYQQALKTDPKLATVWNNCGIALRMLGRFDEAIDHFNEALKIGPGDTYALYQLGVTLVSAGKREEAIGYFRHTIEIDDKKRGCQPHAWRGVAGQPATRRGRNGVPEVS